MKFQIEKCPKCGNITELMFSNNPIVRPICFNCIKNELNYNNIEHADFFCRTYNLPFKPDLWISLVKTAKEEVFKEYTKLFLEDETQSNLYYQTSTADVWKVANREWEKCCSQVQIINRLEPIKEAYIERAKLKWGDYSFEDLVKLDTTYTSTLKANNITNPLQKEAVKMLCKIHIELNQAIIAGDTKAVKDYSTAYSNFAKQAGLEEMIEQTKTDDITTVAELYDFMEKQGFQFKFYDNFDRDEVDKSLKDINECNRRVILESTGLSSLLEEMARKRMAQDEDKYMQEAADQATLQDLLNFKAEAAEIEEEPDEDITEENFNQEDTEDVIGSGS